MEEHHLTYLSLTDPEAKMMKTRSEGIVPGYNIEAVIDGKSHMIALMEVTRQQNDMGMLSVMTDKVMDEYGIYPEKTVTDSGFYNPVDIKKTEVNTETFVRIPKSSRDLDPVSFTYDQGRDEYKCSEGRVLSLMSKGRMKRMRLTDVYKSRDCSGCPTKDRCTKSETGRTYYRYYDESEVKEYKLKMKQEKSRVLLFLRRTIAEHPFETLKLLMGKIPVLLRGREKVQIEFNLHVTVYNIKRLIHLEAIDSLVQRLEGFHWNHLKVA